jgi:endonuclease/exonuclease/phosphatase family metal-dependent hydrolase
MVAGFEEQVAVDDEGDMGVALLSRIALADVERIDLPWHDCPWRPRLAMAATVTLGDQSLRLFNVHIDPHGPLDNQHQQTELCLSAQKIIRNRQLSLVISILSRIRKPLKFGS